MATVTIDRESLKQVVKDALLEVLSERPQVVAKILVEAIEDVGLAEAIRQGRDSEEVSREEIEAILRGEP